MKMENTSDQELLTVDEAAVRLKVDVETVRRWLRSGQLRGLKLGRMWRIPESALSTLATMPTTPIQEAECTS